MKAVVYVGGPFRGANAWEVEENVRRAERIALEVWRAGAVAICPHTNTRFFSGALPDEVWLEGDLEILRRCDAMILAPLWGRSVGTRVELEDAEARGIPVFTTIEALTSWIATTRRLGGEER